MEHYNHFVTIVAGENPEELIKQYSKDNAKTVTIYRADAGLLKSRHIEIAKAYMETASNELEQLQLEDIIETLEEQTVSEFWEDYKEEQNILAEDDEGNILVVDDSDVKCTSYNIGKNLSTPFILNDGRIAFQAHDEEINWERNHLYDKSYYERVWELVMDNAEPANENETKIKRTMGNQTEYFRFFGDKETYAIHSSAFWGYAFLSEETGWVELTPEKGQIEWVMGYYDTFIKPLPKNTLLTIYECRK